MKRLIISKLMDEYTDTEIFPTGGSTADPEAVKDRVLANVKAPKKQMSKRKKILLASALAAVMVLLVGAGFPYFQYRLSGGLLSYEERSDGRIIALVHYGPVMSLEDGRLFFHQDDGQDIDITDLISVETPYIYDGSDPESEMTYYVILGGTPEHYGWFEWITVPDPFPSDERYGSISDENGIVFNYDCEFTVPTDGEPQIVRDFGTARANVHVEGRSNPDWRMFSDFNENTGIDITDFQWLRVAADQLGIPFIDTRGEIEATISAP